MNDKQKIAAVIQELDEKKNEALKKAHKQVNKVCKPPVSLTVLTLVKIYMLSAVMYVCKALIFPLAGFRFHFHHATSWNTSQASGA